MKNTNTNWNLYKTFVAVYGTKNLSHASKILGISNVAVGQNIRELSNQLGVKLFTSHRKGVEPTAEADSIYPKILGAIELIADAESSMAELSNKSKTVIKIAVSAISAEIFLKDYLKEFCIKYPEVKPEISKIEDNLAKQKQQDFIIDVKYRIPHSFKTISLFNTSLTFIAAKAFLKKHGLSTAISKDQLLKFPIIIRKGGFWTDFCAQTGLEKVPFITLPITSADMVYSMTKNSIGIGFFSKELSGGNNDNLVALNVNDIPLPMAVQFVCGYNEKLTKSARAFAEGFAKFCKERLRQTDGMD